jgi:uncharacterized membrane protein
VLNHPLHSIPEAVGTSELHITWEEETDMDSKKRSIAKSVSWRILGIIILGIIAYAVTGNFKEMTIITIIFHGIRLVLYYFHERLWERISWGKIDHPLAELRVKKKLTKDDLNIIKEKLRSLGYID